MHMNAWESISKGEKILSTRLIAEEARIEDKEEPDNTIVYKTDSQKFYNYNRTEHVARDCRNKTTQNLMLRCSKYNSPGLLQIVKRDIDIHNREKQCSIC
ncbi:hypothetical protein WN48_09828 [Eufriesea mexicana]|uniref:Uncharacterized protein n=1 Tax=Eufriesea mexicana TaxID=516756 RepID=A0A310S9J5_9HYME|nr:hypothetical protein WN48_09828 [Eufriesea mexicana]